MADPLFWLGLSILLVAVSLTAVLVAALPALRELGRAARSAEKLFDTLSRELPPTLESIRLTGLEISDLTDDVSEGVQSAGRVVKQFDDSIRGVKKQAKKAQTTTRNVFVGFQAAWKAFSRPSPPRRTIERLSPSERTSMDLNDLLDELSEYQVATDSYTDSYIDGLEDTADDGMATPSRQHDSPTEPYPLPTENNNVALPDTPDAVDASTDLRRKS